MTRIPKKRLDLLFIHPPAVVGDASHTLDADVAFTEQFASIPIGFYSMADNLEKAGFKTAILNLGELAWRHKRTPLADLLRRELKRYEPKAVGLDIHWMIHAGGAVETAQLVRRQRPATVIMAGGITASFFAEQLLKAYPAFDYVLAGECDEAIVAFLKGIHAGPRAVASLPNLVYRQGRRIVRNRIVVPDIRRDLELTRYDLLAHRPVINPDRAILPIVRGCRMNCCHCAGAREAFQTVMNRPAACMLDPARVVALMASNLRQGRDKIYLYGDIRLGGEPYADAFFRALHAARLRRAHVVIEFFRLADEDIVRRWTGWARASDSTLEATHSPESGLQRLRRQFGKGYSDARLLEHCRLLAGRGIPQSVYFMLGIPGQDRAEVDCTLALADELVGIYATRFRKEHLRHDIVSYNFVQVPDAGSLIFQNPDRYGFKLEIRTLRQLVERLTQSRHWTGLVGYSLEHMSTSELVETYYHIQETILRLYLKHRVIEPAEARRQIQRLEADRSQAILLDMIRPAKGK